MLWKHKSVHLEQFLQLDSGSNRVCKCSCGVNKPSRSQSYVPLSFPQEYSHDLLNTPWITPVSDLCLVIKWFIRTNIIKLPKLFLHRSLNPVVLKWIWVKVSPSIEPGNIYIYIYAFSRRFYPKRLTLSLSYSFYILSALAFPGNRTHDLGVASAMLYQLSYRKATGNISRPGRKWSSLSLKAGIHYTTFKIWTGF